MVLIVLGAQIWRWNTQYCVALCFNATHYIERQGWFYILARSIMLMGWVPLGQTSHLSKPQVPLLNENNYCSGGLL